MKHYMKYLWIAVFCGIFCIVGCTKNFSEILLSEILIFTDIFVVPAFIIFPDVVAGLYGF